MNTAGRGVDRSADRRGVGGGRFCGGCCSAATASLTPDAAARARRVGLVPLPSPRAGLLAVRAAVGARWSYAESPLAVTPVASSIRSMMSAFFVLVVVLRDIAWAMALSSSRSLPSSTDRSSCCSAVIGLLFHRGLSPARDVRAR